jgi:hypothetical protein
MIWAKFAIERLKKGENHRPEEEQQLIAKAAKRGESNHGRRRRS